MFSLYCFYLFQMLDVSTYLGKYKFFFASLIINKPSNRTKDTDLRQGECDFKSADTAIHFISINHCLLSGTLKSTCVGHNQILVIRPATFPTVSGYYINIHRQKINEVSKRLRPSDRRKFLQSVRIK